MNHICFFHPKMAQTSWLMIWETNRSRMSDPQEIKVNSLNPISQGDNIISDMDNEGRKVAYEVLEVKDSRPSTIKKMTYYTIQAQRKIIQS